MLRGAKNKDPEETRTIFSMVQKVHEKTFFNCNAHNIHQNSSEPGDRGYLRDLMSLTNLIYSKIKNQKIFFFFF